METITFFSKKAFHSENIVFNSPSYIKNMQDEIVEECRETEF